MNENVKRFRVCYGISSKADNLNGHVLFLDYDKVSLEGVLDHIKAIQKEYDLSDIYILKSTNGYNALCLDVLWLHECFEIGTNVMSPCDRDFFRYGRGRGYYTLRFDVDKRLFMVSRNNNRKTKSLAHKRFLEWYFDIEIVDDGTFNDYTHVTLIQFPSDKNGYHMVDKVLPSYFEVLKHD